MKKTTLLLTAIAAWATPHSQGAVLAGPIFYPANGHYYYLLSANTWTDSEAEAITLGGDLATINDAAENSFVYSTFSGVDRGLWIGLNDVAQEGTFVWASGEAVSYVNWGSGEPSNDGDYIHIFWPGDGREPAWNDNSDINNYAGHPLHGVVESVVPEPCSALLILSGAALCFRRRSLRTHERNA